MTNFITQYQVAFSPSLKAFLVIELYECEFLLFTSTHEGGSFLCYNSLRDIFS